MPELIERKKALKNICKYCSEPKCKKNECMVYAGIKDTPTIEPKVRHGRWISCSERLPEEDVPVICYMRIGEIVIMEYGGDGWYSGITRYNPRAVTHWMPLPEPPEKE